MTPQLAFLLNQAVNCLQNNNDQSAELFLKQAVKLAPKNPDALRFFGIIEAKRQNFNEALSYFQKALKQAPRDVFVNSNIGNVLSELKRYEEALAAYDKAISIEPHYAEAHNNRGNALQALERYDEALIAYDKAISIDPSYAQAFSNRGNALQGLKRYEEALEAYDKALLISPNYVEAYSHKGHALQWLERYDEALIAYDKAISIDAEVSRPQHLNGQYAEAYYNKGLLMQSQRLYREAIEAFEKAIDIRPDYADAYLAAGVLFLRLGEFDAGWKAHEWRWRATNSNSVIYPTNKPTWDGKKTEQRILVWSEQGVGDKIFYSSMFNEVSLLSPKVTVLTDARLLPIYRRSFPKIEFFDEKVGVPDEAFDMQIPMGSLMKILRPNRDSFKNAEFPYLKDDEAKTKAFRTSFDSAFQNSIVCGLAWRSVNKKVGDHKSIPLSALADVLKLDKFEFINLQYDDIAQDLKLLDESVSQKIHQIPDVNLRDDLDGVLSLIQACDLVLTCSNTVAHMAAALNKQTILMMPFEAGKLWYWHAEGGKNLCYPSVEIFSQTKQGDWQEVIEQVKIYMESLSFEE